MEKNTLYPIFVKLDQIQTLLVGAGDVGHEKLIALLRSDPEAHITVVSDEVTDAFAELALHAPNVKVIRRKFFISDLTGKDLVIAATNNRSVNEKIRIEARKRRILTNVADTPDLCDFYLGSVVEKGDLKLGISTNGKSPTMAKRIREMFEGIIPENIQETLDNLTILRANLKVDFSRKVEILNEVTRSFSLKTQPRH